LVVRSVVLVPCQAWEGALEGRVALEDSQVAEDEVGRVAGRTQAVAVQAEALDNQAEGRSCVGASGTAASRLLLVAAPFCAEVEALAQQEAEVAQLVLGALALELLPMVVAAAAVHHHLRMVVVVVVVVAPCRN
jgi:hypothetical protein